MITITSEIIGIERVQSNLVRMEERFTRMKPLFEELGKEFRAQQKSMFDLAPWTPLKKETEAQKARKFGGPTRILVATGTLLRSLTEEDEEGSISRVGDDSAEFGSSIFYGIFHHEGRGSLPERKLIAEPDEDRYNTVAGRYAAEVVREEWVN